MGRNCDCDACAKPCDCGRTQGQCDAAVLNKIARDFGELLSQVRVSGDRPIAFCLVIHLGHQGSVAVEASNNDHAAKWLHSVAEGLELGTLEQSGKRVN